MQARRKSAVAAAFFGRQELRHERLEDAAHIEAVARFRS
jgi:hypothetical protein